MRDKKRQSKGRLAILGAWILMGLVFFCGTGITVSAQGNSFVIEAKLLPANDETYDIQLNVENLGADWEGSVRLVVNEEYRSPSAYDTIISLPQGSTKQFVVKVPINSIEDTDGTVKVSFWNKKSQKSAEKEFKYLLREDAGALVMGILSDDYPTLTYLDMGGAEIFFYGYEYPIKLVELNQDNLLDTLETLEFLVIDTYNTGVLTEEELKAIELWNYDGGVLIVGTGSYAENTLAGLGDSYLGIESGEVYEAEENRQYYYSEYVDLSQLPVAELWSTGQYYEQYMSNALTCAIGDGAIGILPYSLTELAKVDSSFYQNIDQESFVMNIVETISSEANARYNNSAYNSYYNNINYLRRMLRMIGTVNSPLKFGVLKFLVIAYVIFVGPVLYIILRLIKKRELYWVAVPGAALLGILLVFFAGRGFEVVDTRVYSVTTQNLSGVGDSESFLYCFDANNKEWKLQLADGYDYAGSLMNNNYNYDYDADVYYHHIEKEGDTLSFGINPSSNFEDCFFYAGMNAQEQVSGTLEFSGTVSALGGLNGSITNTTDKDLRYFAVIADESLYVYENLPAGESYGLAGVTPIFSSYNKNDIWYDYMYYYMNDIREDEDTEMIAASAALGVGIGSAYKQEDMDKIIIIGVTEDWNKTVNDECSEISYGCLYVVQ